MRTLVAIALISLTSLAHGQIYKWVDAQGKTQYSDQPQPGSKSKAVKVLPSSGAGQAVAAPREESLAEKEAAMKQRRMDKAEATAKEEEEAKRKAEQDSYCKQLKGQQHAALQARRMVTYDENGKRKVLSSDDRKAEIASYEAAIEKNCKN